VEEAPPRRLFGQRILVERIHEKTDVGVVGGETQLQDVDRAGIGDAENRHGTHVRQ